jgi:GNAT superfamily N-acetyltransferase
MRRLASEIGALVTLVRKGDLTTAADRLRRALHSDSIFLGLRRDLDVAFPAPSALIELTIRAMRPDDLPLLLDSDAAGLSGEGRYERMARRRLVEQEIPTCYVAATEDGTPCYMQWLVGPDENDRIQAVWGGVFPLLRPGEALLEAAFTPEAYRGRRIMPAAMARIAERAADLGARWVITFVEQGNIASLKGCERSGFAPYLRERVTWRWFRRSVTREPLRDGSTDGLS